MSAGQSAKVCSTRLYIAVSTSSCMSLQDIQSLQSEDAGAAMCVLTLWVFTHCLVCSVIVSSFDELTAEQKGKACLRDVKTCSKSNLSRGLGISVYKQHRTFSSGVACFFTYIQLSAKLSHIMHVAYMHRLFHNNHSSSRLSHIMHVAYIYRHS